MLSLTSQLSGPFYGALPAKRGIRRILDLIHFPRKASDGSGGKTKMSIYLLRQCIRPPHHAKERALSNLPLVSPQCRAQHTTRHLLHEKPLSSLPPFHPSPGDFDWDQGWWCGICQMSLWAGDEVYSIKCLYSKLPFQL